MAAQMTFSSPVSQQDIKAQQQSLNDAMLAQQQASQRRAAEKPITWEEFYSAPTEVKPQPIDYQRERRRQNWAILADAINAVGAMATAGAGGNVTPVASLTGANQQRYDRMYAQRQQDMDRYNKAVKDAESRAQTMMSLRQQMRDRQNSLDIQAEQARINAEEQRLREMQSAYKTAYGEYQDKDAKDRADKRETKTNNTEIQRLNKIEMDRYDTTPSVGDKEQYYLKSDREAFYQQAFAGIQADEQLISDYKLKGAIDNVMQLSDPNIGNPKLAASEMQRIVDTYYGRSAKAQEATQNIIRQPYQIPLEGDNSSMWDTWNQ